MRVTYILAVIIAVNLQVNATALLTTTDSKSVVANVSSPTIADAIEADGRQLRRVDKYVEEEDDIEEERLFKSIGKWVRKQAARWKESRKMDKLTKDKDRADRIAKNIRFSGGKPGLGA